MRVHIICERLEKDRIIPRLFTTLSEGAKFSISEIPDDKADVNYFSLYLLYPKEGYYKTKTAALFSHREDNVPSKLSEWKRAAQSVNLRLTWSDLYIPDLEQYGKTVKVTPYLDRVKFDVG